MQPVQGIEYDQCSIPLLTPCFDDGLLGVPVLHLFVSDSTPTVTDDPSIDYTEASGPNYASLPLQFFLELIGSNPPLHAVVGAAFTNVGPLDPGSDTVFGWWIDFIGGARPVPMFGGRFAAPIVVNMAGQSLVFDEIQLPQHDCGVSIPLNGITFLDYFENFASENALSHAPLVGGPWLEEVGTWTVFNRKCSLVAGSLTPRSVLLADMHSANGYLRADVVPGGTRFGIAFRGSDTANFWSGTLDSSHGELFLIFRQAGVDNFVTSTFLTVNAAVTYRLEVILDGDTITLTANGGNTITFGAASFNSTATLMGLTGNATTLNAANSILFSPAVPPGF